MVLLVIKHLPTEVCNCFLENLYIKAIKCQSWLTKLSLFHTEVLLKIYLYVKFKTLKLI